jgi:hypothetical protein
VIRRTLSNTIIAWLFIAAGTVGLVYHLSQVIGRAVLDTEHVVILLLRLAAIVAGVGLLRGANWARWLMVGWLAYHVVLSAFHTPSEFAVHGLLFAVVTYFLFRTPPRYGTASRSGENPGFLQHVKDARKDTRAEGRSNGAELE